jgi:hypothetical protein
LKNKSIIGGRKMKIVKVILGLLTAVVVLVGCGNNSAKLIEKETRKWPFYKVEKGDDTIYILGTIHIGDEKMTPLPEVIRHAGKEAEVYASEGGDDVSLLLDESVFMSPKSIESKLNEKSKKKLKQIAKSYDILNDQIFNLTNLGLMMTQYGSNSALNLGVEVIIGYDDYAFSDNKPNIVLDGEGARDNFHETVNEIEVNEFIDSLLTLEEIKKRNVEMLANYHAGNVASIEEDSDSEYSNAELNRALLDDRNILWIPKIVNLTKDHDNIFVYVGAGHLYGENNVLELLEKEGFTVSRVLLNEPIETK